MKLEILAYYKGISEPELLKFIEAAISNHAEYICVSPDTTSLVWDYLQDWENFPKISTLINYPDGCDLTPVKLHSILKAKKHKSTAIDIPINISLLRNDQDLFAKECLAIHTFCEEHAIIDRFTIEYRYLDEAEIVFVAELLNEIGVSGIVNASGFVVDDTIDNLISAKFLAELGSVEVIACGRILTQQHVEMFCQTAVGSVRVRDINTLRKAENLRKFLKTR